MQQWVRHAELLHQSQQSRLWLVQSVVELTSQGLSHVSLAASAPRLGGLPDSSEGPGLDFQPGVVKAKQCAAGVLSDVLSS